jgi:ATP-dependent helicase/DNAse subunit B
LRRLNFGKLKIFRNLLKNALFFLKKRNALNIFGKFSIFRKLDGATFFKSVTFFCDYFLVLQSDTMEERIERIGRIRTDFFQPMPEFQAKNQKKSVWIRRSAQSVLPLYRFAAQKK